MCYFKNTITVLLVLLSAWTVSGRSRCTWRSRARSCVFCRSCTRAARRTPLWRSGSGAPPRRRPPGGTAGASRAGQWPTTQKESKVKFVLFNDATGTHWFLSYHRLLDVIHMVTLTHVFLEGNPLPPHRLLFSISSKGSFICTFP